MPRRNSVYDGHVFAPALDNVPFLPKMNSYEHADFMTGSVTVTVAFGLPGMKPDAVTIHLLHDKLTVSGESADTLLETGQEEIAGRICLSEMPHGKFSRVVMVPLGIRDVKAVMENGLLKVTYPKEPPGQEPYHIPIETRCKLDVYAD